jgi:hypothetical protein
VDQKYDGAAPMAELNLRGRRVTRSVVANDWGLQLRWFVTKDGKPAGTAPARADDSYEHADATPGAYEIVLQTWKYVNYAKGADGEFTASKFIPISNVVRYTI